VRGTWFDRAAVRAPLRAAHCNPLRFVHELFTEVKQLRARDVVRGIDAYLPGPSQELVRGYMVTLQRRGAEPLVRVVITLDGRGGRRSGRARRAGLEFHFPAGDGLRLPNRPIPPRFRGPKRERVEPHLRHSSCVRVDEPRAPRGML